MADHLPDKRPPAAGTKIVRRIIPVLLLAVVLVRMLSIIGDYRSARSLEGASGSSEASSSVEATESSGATEGAADEQATGAETGSDDVSESTTRYVVVLIPGLNFRTEPKSGADIMRTLPENTRLTLLGEQNGWYQVRDDDGVTGWVSAKPQYVEVVTE